MLCCLPAFLIIPGIIYDNYKGALYGINKNQFFYSLFFGLTSGIGPALIYLIKYEEILKRIVQENRRET